MDTVTAGRILPHILQRRTVRSFVRDAKMTHDHMLTLLEAACRAGSSYNAQPWRFWYAHHSSPVWGQLFNLLIKPNAAWAINAEWLMLVGAASKMVLKDVIVQNHEAQFDTGAACQNLALQASFMGFGSAIVAGFNHAEAAALIQDPNIEPLVMVVLGSQGESFFGESSMRWPLSEIAADSFDKHGG